MASIVDSIRSVYQERFSLFKIGIFSSLIYFFVHLLLNSYALNFVSVLIVLIVSYLYFGYSSIIVSNRINQRMETLPGYDIFTFLNVASKAFSIAFPYLAVGYFISNLMVDLFSFEGVSQVVAIWLIRFFIFAIMGSALIRFSQNFEIKDGVDFSKVFSGVPDVMVYTIFCIISLLILGVFIVAPVLFLIHRFFEFGALFQFFSVFYVTAMIAVLSDYWGQLHYDIECRDNYY